jgi:bifunctional non-homologous end joining protein LigD
LNVVKCAQQSEIRRTSRPNPVHKSQPGIYQPGRRSKSWLKIKLRMQQETVIGGITEPSGSRKHFGALMLGVYDGGKLRYVGHTGTFSDEMLKDLKPARECNGLNPS